MFELEPKKEKLEVLGLVSQEILLVEALPTSSIVLCQCLKLFESHIEICMTHGAKLQA